MIGDKVFRTPMTTLLASVLAACAVVAVAVSCGGCSAATSASASASAATTAGSSATTQAATEDPHSQASFERSYPSCMAVAGSKVILDTDSTYLYDDTEALFALLQADSCGWVDLLGITTVGGNGFMVGETYDELSVLDYLGRSDVPVCMGAAEPLEGFKDPSDPINHISEMSFTGIYSHLGDFSASYADSARLATTNLPAPTTLPSNEDAVDFLIRQVEENPGEVTIFAIGPCTNIARAIQEDPTFAEHAAGIIYMGGVIETKGQDLEGIELNWWYDPEAASIALRADWKQQTVVPHDAGLSALHGRDVYERYLANDTTKMTSLYVEKLAPIYDAGKEEDPIYCWDPITVAAFLDPSLVTSEKTLDLDVSCVRDGTYAMTESWAEGTGPSGTRACRVILGVDRDAFWDFTVGLFAIDTTGYDR